MKVRKKFNYINGTNHKSINFKIFKDFYNFIKNNKIFLIEKPYVYTDKATFFYNILSINHDISRKNIKFIEKSSFIGVKLEKIPDRRFKKMFTADTILWGENIKNNSKNSILIYIYSTIIFMWQNFFKKILDKIQVLNIIIA